MSHAAPIPWTTKQRWSTYKKLARSLDEIGLSWLERFRNFLPGQFRRQEYQVVLQDLGEQREVSAPDPLEVEPDSQDSVGHHTPDQGGSQGVGAQ